MFEMQKLQDIEVRTETSPDTACQYGNALPILHEILHAMQRLNTDGESTIIDLRSIPFGPGDEEKLLNILGVGEIQVKLDSLGASEIWETQYHGVWVIDHKNTVDERIALQIEVTQVPEILLSQQTDITESISRLYEELSAASFSADSIDVSSIRRRDG